MSVKCVFMAEMMYAVPALPRPVRQERNLFGDPLAVDLLFDQAKADLKVDKIKVTSSLQETLDNAGTNPVKVRERH